MNIFAVDANPEIAARQHVDKHVVKQILESAQMLSAVRIKNGLPAPYKLTHKNHPCTIWAGESNANYDWLYDLFLCLLAEYTHRYGKIHACERLVDQLRRDFDLGKDNQTPFATAMPDERKVPGDPVESYRQYYMNEKIYLANWKNRETPEWFDRDRLVGKIFSELDKNRRGLYLDIKDKWLPLSKVKS